MQPIDKKALSGRSHRKSNVFKLLSIVLHRISARQREYPPPAKGEHRPVATVEQEEQRFLAEVGGSNGGVIADTNNFKRLLRSVSDEPRKTSSFL